MTYQRNPFFALVPKYERFGGRKLPIPLIYGNPQSRSRVFGTAQTQSASSSSKVEAYELTRVKDYAIATIDNETMEASEGDKNAFIEAATTEIDGAMNALTNSLAMNQYKSGYGERGVVGAINTLTITLTKAANIVHFEVGMQLRAASTLAASVLRAGIMTVTAVDRSNGTFTVDALATGLAANDYIFAEGDREDSATPVRTMCSGLEAWVPGTAPTGGDNFFGVDRSLDVTRLAGYRLAAAGMSIEEALIEGEALVSRGGFYIDHYFMSHTKMAELKKSLGSKVQYVDLQANPKVSFRGVLIEGNSGTVRCVADRNCPDDTVYGVAINMFKYYSLGKAVRMIGNDGNMWLRQASADGIEVRVGYYGNLGCRAPGYAVNIQF